MTCGAEPKRLRLDKFLKVSRLAKRRTEAKDALDAGRIECDGRPVKPSHIVKAGDVLLIRYATRSVRVRVDSVPERSAGRSSGACYTVLEELPG